MRTLFIIIVNVVDTVESLRALLHPHSFVCECIIVR